MSDEESAAIELKPGQISQIQLDDLHSRIDEVGRVGRISRNCGVIERSFRDYGARVVLRPSKFLEKEDPDQHFELSEEMHQAAVLAIKVIAARDYEAAVSLVREIVPDWEARG